MGQPRRRPPARPVEQQLLTAVAGFFGDVFKALFGGGPAGGMPAARAEELGRHWRLVEARGATAQAVSEADKLLDAAFKARGLRGGTMGERLKSAEKLLGNGIYQRAWNAHKVRNRVAHELGHEPGPAESAEALAAFRSALRALGVPA